MECKYRVILSIDGGGIKGVVPLKILADLQKEIASIDPDVIMSKLVDLFSGSSTGSILGGALMLQDSYGNFKFSALDMLNMYLTRGKQIFSKNLGLDPTNSVYPLSFILNHFFGNITVSEIKKRFLFVSYDLKSESQYLFTDTADRFRDLPLSKMMIACSAYPGIYPPLTLGELELADGIVAAKNPSELAYNYAKLFFPDDPIILLSLGTGQNDLDGMDLIDKEMEQVHLRMERIQQSDNKLLYFRLQPPLKNKVDIDSEITDEGIRHLIEETEEYMKTNRREVKRLLSLIKMKVDQMV
jgi:patatin-like phospholipase/acyl hydrolase